MTWNSQSLFHQCFHSAEQEIEIQIGAAFVVMQTLY